MVFPCIIDIKVFVYAQAGADDMIRQVVLEVIHPTDLLGLCTKTSSKGRYRSLSCKVRARNKTLIDTLFRRLTSHPEVVMVL